MKSTLILALTMAAFAPLTRAEILECKFDTGSWQFAVTMYFCSVQNHSAFGNRTLDVHKIEGQHLRNRANRDVQGVTFTVVQNVHFLPRNLDFFFANLIALQLYNSDVVAIGRRDLSVFPKLKYLYLCCNRLEVIEAGLFESNPDLELIWLQKNRIWHIDPFVFSFLHKLKVLWLDGNNCSKSFGDVNNSGEVEAVVKRIEDEGCSNSRFTSQQIHDKIEREAAKIQTRLDGFSSILRALLDASRELNVKVTEISAKIGGKVGRGGTGLDEGEEVVEGGGKSFVSSTKGDGGGGGGEDGKV